MTSYIPRQFVSPYIDIQEIKEHEDGSATFSVTVDKESFANFAKIGMMRVLIEAAEDIIALEDDSGNA
jgi:hypothetical protein